MAASWGRASRTFKLYLVPLPQCRCGPDGACSRLPPPNRQEIGMHVMPTWHFDDAGRRRLALLNDPKRLDRRPSPPPLRTRQNRNLAHVCSFACKSISKLSQARLSPGRRPSPEGYEEEPSTL